MELIHNIQRKFRLYWYIMYDRCFAAALVCDAAYYADVVFDDYMEGKICRKMIWSGSRLRI